MRVAEGSPDISAAHRPAEVGGAYRQHRRRQRMTDEELIKRLDGAEEPDELIARGIALVNRAAEIEAGRLRSDEVWIVGTDYADDEIFGVTATRAEAERAAIGHDGDLPLHVVRYTVPYPSRPGGSDG